MLILPSKEDDLDFVSNEKTKAVEVRQNLRQVGQLGSNTFTWHCSEDWIICQWLPSWRSRVCLGDPSSGKTGTLRTYGCIHSDLAIKIPQSLSFEISAGSPVIYGTVIYSLGHTAQIHADDKILIHAAAGSIGQAAIQHAKVKRGEIFVILSSMNKEEFIMEIFGVAEDHIFSSRDLSFSQGANRLFPGVLVLLLFATH